MSCVEENIVARAAVADADSSYRVETKRQKWSHPIEFILSCMNFAIGLGNVWRYPYLAYRNGGGAFLIPYFLAACFMGLPIFFAELLIGQYSGLSPIKAFTYLSPFFKGLGYSNLMITFTIGVYYFVVISWIFYYFYVSFFPSLKWGSCDNDWNTDMCNSLVQDLECQVGNIGSFTDQIFFNRTCRQVRSICEQYNLSPVDANNCFNISSGLNMTIPSVIPRVFSSEEFFFEHVLNIGNASWSNWGLPNLHIVVCLLIAWILNALAVAKGVKSVGKVVYFTALFPFVILTALLIRGLTLPGSTEGIMFYVIPQWDKLASSEVWGDASSQIFYSYSLAVGALVTLASYNKFNNNCHSDAVIVSLVNYLTAFYAGFAVFSILGFLAHSINVDISVVATSGPGLSFVAFPEAILLMPVPQLWAILFFFMMIILGLGSTFAPVQMVITTIIDHWPHLRQSEWKVTIGVCCVGFLCGLPLICPGGIFLFTLLERHTASWAILLIGFSEIVILSWAYGFNKTFEMISTMGIKINKYVKYIYWRPVLVVITPIYTITVFIFVLTKFEKSRVRDYVFPDLADTFGWLIGTATIVPLITIAIYQSIKHARNGSIRGLFEVSEKWGKEEIDGKLVERSLTCKSN